MNIPRVEIFEWLLQNYEKADYILAFSNIPGLSMEEYDRLTGFSIPKDFDLGWDAHYGAEELKKALACMYDCSQENVVTSSGGSEANFLVFLALLDSDSDFIIEQPGYQPMWLSPLMLGANKIDWHRKFENGFALDPQGLKEIITDKTKLIVLTNLHNPTGNLASRETIKEISDIAKAKGAYIVIDEIFLDGAFVPQESGFGIDNVIITSSMTKVYGLGGFRTGWVIGPKEIAEKCQIAKAHTNAASSFMSEVMNARALIEARSHLVQRFKNTAHPNLKIVKEWADENPDLVEMVEPLGGILCYPKYNGDIPSKELCQRLLDDHKILINPGYYFGLEGHFRLSYACPENVLRGGLKVLTQGLKDIL